MAGNLVPSIKFIKGNSKHPLVPGVCIIDDRYKFYFNKVISDGQASPVSLFYQCGSKKISKCAASVVLVKDDEKWWPQNLSADEVHNHASDRAAVLAELMKKEMYNKVSKQPETKSNDAYRDVITEYEDRYGNDELVWDQAIGNLKSKDNMSRNMRMRRKKEHGPLPKNRDEFDPEVVIKETLGGQKVILLDSNKDLDKKFYKKLENFKNDKTVTGDTSVDDNEAMIGLVDYSDSSIESNEDTNKPKRVIAFTTKLLLTLFNQRKSSGDGTFKISPLLWKQLYVVMIKFSGSWVPVFYALLPDKSQESYFTMFYMLKKQLKELNLPFNIESLRTDFEIAEMKAAAAALNVEVKGCYFHFTQSGWRFVQSNNMASAYLADRDQEFKLFIRCVLSLPHVPIEDIEDTLEILHAKNWDFGDSVEKHEFKEKFLENIKEYWVNGVYPPQVWNCFRRKVDLTNNNNEAHNKYLADAVKEAHPSPATLTVALIKELTMAETKLKTVKSGARRVLKKKYRDLNSRRENLKSMYQDMNRIEYLSQIGHIVMHINLNKGQMSELNQARQQDVPENNLIDGDLDDSNDDHDLSLVSGTLDSGESSEITQSTETNDTVSSDEVHHAFENRVLGKTVKNGKEASDHVEPEYKGKKCLVCKGKFNVKSKYQVCKLCDRLVHVNNNKKCHKMRKFFKDDNFICCDCLEATDDQENVSQESSSIHNETYKETQNLPSIESQSNFESDTSKDNLDVENEQFENISAVDGNSRDDVESINYADYTIGTQIAFRNLETPGNEICDVCEISFQSKEAFMKHMNDVHWNPCTHRCDICDKTFISKEDLGKHMDEMHFNPCPICEKTFFRTVEKLNHMSEQHKNISAVDGNSRDGMESINYADYTINGHQIEGLVFRNLETPNTEICDVCERLFQSKEALVKHMDEVHWNPCTYKCDICEKTFLSKEDLGKHMPEQHNQSIPSEESFIVHIQRQSTLLGHGRMSKVNVQFTGDVLEPIKDMKKRRKGAR